eukprot:snap_masked-scaffold2986_size10850-processed-gene-0.1 protein:Tk03240 transcript:snap_masked-scaffold2986_size10850-processed-gene-0.1-mRNA-1 annotation:"PREDICTED: uncharacterized protein K02A2.6-like"
MRADIKKLVERCSLCQEYKRSLPLEPFAMAEPVSAPMVHESMDLFEAASLHWLVMVDRFSGYIFPYKLRGMAAMGIIDVTWDWLLEFGRPEVIWADGGPQFRTEFQHLCGNLGIAFKHSSPGNPRSNGLAESAVNMAKMLVMKCWTGRDLRVALEMGTDGEGSGSFSDRRYLVKTDGRKVYERNSCYLLPIQVDEPDVPEADCIVLEADVQYPSHDDGRRGSQESIIARFSPFLNASDKVDIMLQFRQRKDERVEEYLDRVQLDFNRLIDGVDLRFQQDTFVNDDTQMVAKCMEYFFGTFFLVGLSDICLPNVTKADDLATVGEFVAVAKRTE